MRSLLRSDGTVMLVEQATAAAAFSRHLKKMSDVEMRPQQANLGIGSKQSG